MMLKPALRPPLRAPMRGATTLREGVGGWWASDAVLDADFANARFRWDGVSYSTLADWLTAIGGVNASGLLSIGPYVAPDAVELATNGDFAGGLTGWTATQISGGPATFDASSGEGVLTGNGADSPALRNDIPVQVGRAYQGRGKVKRGASGSLGPSVRFSTGTSLGGGNLAAGANNGTTSFVETVLTMTPWAAVSTAYFGMRMIANPANGTGNADDFSVKECTPFKNFVAAALSGLIVGTTPGAASGSKVIWQTDDGSIDNTTPIERNYIRLYWASDKHLHLLVTYQATAGSTTTQADLDLGVVEVSTPFRVAFSCAPNSFIASLDGQPALSDASGTFPGAAVMRFGKSQTTANNWDGTTSRVTLYAATKSVEEVENLAAPNVQSLIAAWGDSLTNGTGSTGGSTYPAQAAALFTPDRAVANKGVGGETSTQIKTRMLASTVLRPRTAWIWAGRNNYTAPTTVKNDIAEMIASLGHDRYLIGSIINGEYTSEYQGQSNYNTMMQLNADLAAIYGARYVDVRTPLVAEGAPGGSVPNATDYGRDIVPSGLRSDNIHLLNAGYAIVAAAFKAANDAMGW